MILSKSIFRYFGLLQSKVLQTTASFKKEYPYLIKKENFFIYYECLRDVWINRLSIKEACEKYRLNRSTYYLSEKRFVESGVFGLFSMPAFPEQSPHLENLAVLVKKGNPSLSYTTIHRIAQAVPLTKEASSPELISMILQSHGIGISSMASDEEFWGRVQRKLHEWFKLKNTSLDGRDPKARRETFFSDEDVCQGRLELFRELFFNPEEKLNKTCMRFGINISTFYRLLDEYKLYGHWAFIPGYSHGKEGVSPELQLSVLLNKLRHPEWSAEVLVKNLKLKVSRFAVHRVITQWELQDKDRPAIALDEYLGKALGPESKHVLPNQRAAYHLLPPEKFLSTRRINRHFELIRRKMKIRPYHICDPGPFLLAPFVNELGVAQAFETYGPDNLRGKEATNIALLNVFRILAGYRRISHLRDNRDRGVALASGFGMYGSTSKYYERSMDFKFSNLQDLRNDLVLRAKELGLIEGIRIGFDFHFKEFYGSNARDKFIGKGPAKSGDLVPGFRPHIAWDLAANVIINIAYFQGGTRAPRILQSFCEQNIFPILDPLAIQEIYMDSEYTKEGDFNYLKQVTGKKGEVYVCLKQNKQIKKLIQPALDENKGWKNYEEGDEVRMIKVKLPHTGLSMAIVILRNREKKDNIRCFGSTKLTLSIEEILNRYRYRWLVENGIKDLVTSYFINETYGLDPEKIEFDFYCVMVARLAYEYFIKELGDHYLNNENGNKITLSKMRNLLLEKRNCNIEVNNNGDFILTNLDSSGDMELEKDVSNMLVTLRNKGLNKILWWNQQGVFFKYNNQYQN